MSGAADGGAPPSSSGVPASVIVPFGEHRVGQRSAEPAGTAGNQPDL